MKAVIGILERATLLGQGAVTRGAISSELKGFGVYFTDSDVITLLNNSQGGNTCPMK